MTDQTQKQTGEIARVADDSIGYVYLRDANRTLFFVPSAIDGYRGESFSELGLRVGTQVEFEAGPDAIEILKVRVPVHPTDRALVVKRSDDDILLPNRNAPSGAVSAQLVLHPDRLAAKSAPVTRALPEETRKFGKLLDTSALAPGDLLLTSDLKPDGISRLIVEVQQKGGYHADDARWTHAAMYTGDGASVVEATFDNLREGGDVRLSSLDEYCTGKHVLRFRRSRFLKDSQLGWKVCVRAFSRLKQPYSFAAAARMWFNVAIRGNGFYDDSERPISKAAICSTLYADSYNEATRRLLGEVTGVCVPAWLSGSDEFEDLQPEWLSIGR